MEDILIGSTDRTILVFIPDPASTTGAGKTGLAAAAVTVTYTRVETDNDVVHTDVTSSVNDLSALTDAHNDWGWKEVSSTLSKGLYRLDVADAVFASGAWYAVVQVTITSGTAAATPKQFKLVNFDMFGQSAADLKDFADDGYDPSTNKIQGLTAADSVTGAVGSVTGAVGSVTGNVGGNVTGSVGSVVGNVGGNVVGSTASVSGAVGSVTGNVGGNVTGSVGSVVGAVGSVTGAVGSVTGNLGGNVNGNVVGSVGSVTGAVGSVTGAVGSVTGDVGGKVLGGGSGTITGDGVQAASVTGAVGSVSGAVGSVTGNVGGNITGNVSGDVAGKVLGGGASVISGDGVRAASVTGAVGSVTGAVGSVTGAVGSVTGNVGGNVTGSVGSLGAQAQVDVAANSELLDWEAVDPGDIPDRCAMQAQRFLRNAHDASSGTHVDVMEEDDTTVAWSKAINTDPSAEPITGTGADL